MRVCLTFGISSPSEEYPFSHDFFGEIAILIFQASGGGTKFLLLDGVECLRLSRRGLPSWKPQYWIVVVIALLYRVYLSSSKSVVD